MKKTTTILMTILLSLVLVACSQSHAIKAYFVDMNALSRSVSFSIEIEDPKQEITGSVIIDIIDLETNQIFQTRTLQSANDYQGISFVGLNSAKTYRIDIRAIVGKESITVASHQLVLIQDEIKTITTPEEFLNMNNNPEGNYVLGNDIDFEGVNFQSLFSTVAKAFQGTFDGRGYTIKNIKIQNVGQHTGIFAYVSSGKVLNLTIDGIQLGSVEQPLTSTNSFKVGILSGYVSQSNARIENITIKNASIYVSSGSTYQFHVGGVVGDLRGSMKNITIENSKIVATATSFARVYIGGVAGFVSEASKISEVESQMDIAFNLEAEYLSISDKSWIINIGGVVGDYNSRITKGLQNVIHRGDIDVTLDFGTPEGQKGFYDVYVGGITGRAYGPIDHAYYAGSILVSHEINANETTILKSFYVGGISGYFQSNLITNYIVYDSTNQSIEHAISSDVRLYSSYTFGANLSVDPVSFIYVGNGTLTRNQQPISENVASIKVNGIQDYFESEWMISRLS